jgi:16S rRNA (cytidine1402-2'-O)-methyltransferase
LLVCATPIGNLDDVTLRVLDALRRAHVIACEDTRHTQILLDRHGISARHLLSLHEHNERSRAKQLSERVRAGATVALVSDAGTPLISDPGFALVRACLARGLDVQVLPGPSAPVAALVVSGLPADSWRFVGFLPRQPGRLQRLLAHAAETVVAFESARRVPGVLRALADLEPERPVAVCRELTKLHEEVRRGSARELARAYGDERSPVATVRGEIVLVIGAATSQDGSEEALAALRELVQAGVRPRPGARVIARLTGASANRLYRELARERR